MESDFTKYNEAILSLRRRLEPVWREEFAEDHYIFRFLKARDFDLDKTEKMILDSLAWRKAKNIDNLIESYVKDPILEQYMPGSFVGQAKDGTPLYIEPIGKLDPIGLAHLATKDDILLREFHLCEYVNRVLLPEISKKEGRTIYQLSIIYDMDDFGRQHMTKKSLQYFIDLMKQTEANYPETMCRTFIVNAPKVFPLLYKIMSPFMNTETRKKIIVLGKNFSETLLEYVSADNLPKIYGGTMANDDPSLKKAINFNGKVPCELYKKMDKSTMTKIQIGRGSSTQLKYTITKPYSTFEVRFTSDSHDISFGVYFVGSSKSYKLKDLTAVKALSRLEAHLIPELQEVECKMVGEYVVVFDNSYSWTRGKTVWYTVDVKENDYDDAVDPSYDEFYDAENFDVNNEQVEPLL